MKTLRWWKAGALLALVCLIAGAAAAQERDLKLDRWVGKYPEKEFLSLPAVHDPLAHLMGDRLKRFLSRFQVVTPIDRVARDIVAAGCVRHDCADEQVAFALDLDTGKVAAASLRQGKYMDIYSNDTTTYDHLPPGLRRWISSRTSKSQRFKRMKFTFYK